MPITARIAFAAALFACASVHAACPPTGEGLERAQGLVDCLSEPDPALRDALGFTGLQKMLRGKQLDTAGVQVLRVRLVAMLGDASDTRGFRQPFAALGLAEVARVDRLQAFMSPAERGQVVDAAVAYLTGVNDYRGFDEREGWRHGVAHGADLVQQLSLNPQLSRAQADAMLGAIGKQVLAGSDHFYRYGEGERLSAPVFHLARRGVLSPVEWEQWLMAVVARVPKGGGSQQALAARHNAVGFMSSLYVAVAESGNAEAGKHLMPGLKKAVKGLD